MIITCNCMLCRDLDVRIAVSCSPHNTDTQGLPRMKEIAEEMCHGMSLRCIKWLLVSPTAMFYIYCTLHYITSMYVCIVMDHAVLPGQILPINLAHLGSVHCILTIRNWHIKSGPL